MKRSCLVQQLLFICLSGPVSLDDVVNLRVEGVSELLLAGVLTLQAQGASSDRESDHNYFMKVRKKSLLILLNRKWRKTTVKE